MNYQVVEETLFHQDIGYYKSYGICAYHMKGAYKEEVAHISDVFLCEETAQKFAARCNQLKLDLVHLKDAIEDAVNDIA